MEKIVKSKLKKTNLKLLSQELKIDDFEIVLRIKFLNPIKIF